MYSSEASSPMHRMKSGPGPLLLWIAYRSTTPCAHRQDAPNFPVVSLWEPGSGWFHASQPH